MTRMFFKARYWILFEDNTWLEQTQELLGDPEWPEEILDMIGEHHLDAVKKLYIKVKKVLYMGVCYA